MKHPDNVHTADYPIISWIIRGSTKKLSNRRLAFRAFRQMFDMLRWAVRHWLAGTRFLLGVPTKKDRKITEPGKPMYETMMEMVEKSKPDLEVEE